MGWVGEFGETLKKTVTVLQTKFEEFYANDKENK